MAETQTTPELTPADAAKRIGDGSVEVVDVRTEDEHAASHIVGARHVPFERLQRTAGELDHGRPVVFYCRSGDRSAAAADAFRASGWDASSISGGLVAWVDEGLPVEPEGAEVADRSKLPGE